jgi:hypothetical protein
VRRTTNDRRVAGKVPGEPVLADGPGNGNLCVLETTVGDRFRVARPAMSKEQELALIDVLREILVSWKCRTNSQP